MKIFFDNVNFESHSGPNSFARKISNSFMSKGHEVESGVPTSTPEIQFSFISAKYKIAPIIQRLDGIYFNSEQDFNHLNIPIESTYSMADAAIFQSSFNKNLVHHYFGSHENSHIINNGTDLDSISKISPLSSNVIDEFETVWSCASSWRPHKRLSENIRYFLEFSSEDDCLIIAGNNPDFTVADPRIFYAGDLDWESLISLYRRSKYFLHLSWLDHCPNVVVDARASGCHIICSSTGGTSEIAGKNSTIINEDEWDFSPIKLYKPPEMDFSNICKEENEDISIDINEVADRYLDVFGDVLCDF